MKNTGGKRTDAEQLRSEGTWPLENVRLRPNRNPSYDDPGSYYPERAGYEPDERRIFPGRVNSGRGAGNPQRERPFAGRRRRFTRFEKYAAEGTRFIREIADELRTGDLTQTLRLTKAVLHAFRDRLGPDDAVQFAQGLPAMLKAVYFDQYDPSCTPVVIRHKEDFLDFIREKNSMEMHDYSSSVDVVLTVKAVFNVLERNLDPGQLLQVKKLLPREIQRMVGEPL